MSIPADLAALTSYSAGPGSPLFFFFYSALPGQGDPPPGHLQNCRMRTSFPPTSCWKRLWGGGMVLLFTPDSCPTVATVLGPRDLDIPQV